MPDLGALVARDYLATMDASKLFESPVFRSALKAQDKQISELTETLSRAAMPALPIFDKLSQSMAAAAAAFDSPAMHSVLEAQEKQVAALSAALSKLVMPDIVSLDNIQKAIASLGAANTTLSAGPTQNRLNDAISTAD